MMVLQYANQGNLREYLKNKFISLEWNDKVQLALDITRGLKCLHSRKIIHRDLVNLYYSVYFFLIQFLIKY